MSQIHINTIADLCAKHGIRKAIISPGSRNAPLIIAFNRHPKIECFSISDERSAAFIALGMAQGSQQTVAIICTSGSAALNYAPAVAEAYFQEVPLLVITADRPPEWIDQWDGQTIRQKGIYGQHIKASYHLPVVSQEEDSWQAYRKVNEACIQASTGLKGPVHINIPFREPFYPAADEKWAVDQSAAFIEHISSAFSLGKEELIRLRSEFASYEKVAFLLGQQDYPQAFLDNLDDVSQKLQIPVYADIISNGHSLKNAIRFTDSIGIQLQQQVGTAYVPDLVISFGRSIISKQLKLFLRKNKVAQWHIDSYKNSIADPFSSLQKLIQTEPSNFLEEIQTTKPKANSFLDSWTTAEKEVKELSHNFLKAQAEFNEFSALYALMQHIPDGSQLHLANSLSVRYINFIGSEKADKVWCNRGTSGIDGSNSTAMGHAVIHKDQQHILITGDVAFFYDRNAFWHKYPYDNLKVVLINNHGGSIFKMIKGPKEQQELEDFFVTEQRSNASHLCAEFGIEYTQVNEQKDLTPAIQAWLSDTGCSLLEIQTNSEVNQRIFESFKHNLIK